MTGPRRLAVLGSTGSIGTQVLDVVAAHPERFAVVALAAGSDADTLAAQARKHGVRDVALADATAAGRLRDLLPTARVREGVDAAAELAALIDVDLVVNGITGSRGLPATLAALAAGHHVALANKESLIVGGDLVVQAAEKVGPDALVPIDSEHSALAQCLRGGTAEEVERLVLTASGGPFRGRRRHELAAVSSGDALAHPTWQMGPVITVNSATLMNKGLELIEAHLLFGIAYERLDVVIHPQSVVHSMVEFRDGSTIAQLSPPDMRLPIQLALTWPERLGHAFARLDWTAAQQLTFEPLDRATFPAVDLALAAGHRGGTFPAVLNAANEQAVAAFLAGRIGLLDIAEAVERVLAQHTGPGSGTGATLDDVLSAEAWARARANELLEGSP